MKDGDLVSVLPILPRFENAVTLRGNVATPLRYPYRQGMRIRDLIPDREILVTPDYYRRQNLAVRPEPISAGIVRPDGSVQRQEGTVDVQQRQEALTQRQDPVTQAKLVESVRRLSAEINWDYAVVER